MNNKHEFEIERIDKEGSRFPVWNWEEIIEKIVFEMSENFEYDEENLLHPRFAIIEEAFKSINEEMTGLLELTDQYKMEARALGWDVVLSTEDES